MIVRDRAVDQVCTEGELLATCWVDQLLYLLFGGDALVTPE